MLRRISGLIRCSFSVAAGVCVIPGALRAQSVADARSIRGLSGVAVLPNTPEGNAALASNYVVTNGIQTGKIRQPPLLPFIEERQQALRDTFITDGNLADLADGLGSTLEASYIGHAHYVDRTHFTSFSRRIAGVIAYAETVTATDAATAKFFFANGTSDGRIVVSAGTLATLKSIHGKLDVFGDAYGKPASAEGPNAFGNPRPFQTEPSVSHFSGSDYFNAPSSDMMYEQGPIADLTNSPSYPSGHTTYAYTGALILAVLVPERYQELMVRAAEYGNGRILLGAHYAMDVIAGRTLAMYDMAHLLANDTAYVGRTMPGGLPIRDFRSELSAARQEMKTTLQEGCGNTLEVCARQDIGRFNKQSANEAFYISTQTYNLPVVYPKNFGTIEDVGKLAPEAGYLLTLAFPKLSLGQADEILSETEGEGGGFLDDGSSFGVYSRLNLVAAANRAAAKAK